MRGDQLSRQWRFIRAIEASHSGLTLAEIAINGKKPASASSTVTRKRSKRPSFPCIPKESSRPTAWLSSIPSSSKSLPSPHAKPQSSPRKSGLNLPTLKIYLIRFLGRISRGEKGFLRPWYLSVNRKDSLFNYYANTTKKRVLIKNF